ncbi:MAG: transglycosylase SLT domain-containing protein [Myxococcota bacterium]
MMWLWMSLGMSLGISSSWAATPEAVAALLSAGDCARAVAAMPSPSDDPGRLAIARCQLKLNQPRRALELLAPVLDGPFRDYAALLAGEAGLQLGRPADAAAVLKMVTAQGASGQRAQMLRGRALIESKAYLEGRDVLRPLLQTELAAAGVLGSPLGADPAEVRWWLAEGARLRGEPEKAIPVWRIIWTHNPTSPFARKAADRLAAHSRPVPNADDADGRALIRTRISTLQKLNLHDQAMDLYDMLPADNSPAGLKKRARMAFQARNYPLANNLYAQLPSPTPQERFNHALGTSRIGDYDTAEQLYMALFQAHPDHSLADFASFKVGYLAYDANRLEECVALFRQHLRRYASSKHADEARWFIGWSLYRLEKFDDADRVFAELLQKHGRSSLAPGARYWQAQIAERSGNDEVANAGYQEVLRRWPNSGHAWFSAEKLQVRYSPKAVAQAPSPPAGVRGDAWDRGVALAAVGLDAWAREQLGPLVGAARASGKQGQLAMAHALIDAGDYVTAQSLARAHCTSPWKGGDPVAMQACYPRPQGVLVDQLTTQYDLDRNLPYAIMTAESALRPEVSSPAGARGLMQLMPSLGAELHALSGHQRPYNADDLFQPGYNASLGVMELDRLQNRFTGMPMTIAGYNGGADAVARWVTQQGGSPPLDVFAENVGYTETRRYVRKVLGYIQTYRYIYGDR